MSTDVTNAIPPVKKDKEIGCNNSAEMPSPIAQLYAEIAQAVSDAAKGIGDYPSELIYKFHACEVFMDAEYPKNEFLFSVDDVPFITRGDIHTIGAKQKGGKTTLVLILIAAILCGQWHRVKCFLKGLRVLYIDTEMKQIDTQTLGKNAAAMANVEMRYASEYIHLVNFRPLTPDEMEKGIRYFVNKYQPDLVIIDGIVDLCSNFNDVEASQNLVLNFLMKIAEESKCAIINVLHTNKTDGYTELRGHLGAFFEQKGVTVIKCEKDDNTNIVTVNFPTHRYAPIPEFHFTFDSNGLPVDADSLYRENQVEKQKTDKEKKAAEKEAEYQKRVKIVVSILKENGGIMEQKQLVDVAMNRLDKGMTTVKNLITKICEDPTPAIAKNGTIVKLI